MPVTLPDGAELKAFLLNEAGITASISDARADAIMLSVVEELERETGFSPFFAADTATARLFDPPGSVSGPYASPRGGSKYLKLNAGAVEVTQVKRSGTVLVAGSDYWLQPSGTVSGVSWPYTGLLFAAAFYGAPQSVEVTAKWGFTATLTGGIKRAIMERAAAVWAESYKPGMVVVDGEHASPSSWKDDDVAESFDAQAVRDFGKGWRESSERRFKNYAMVTVYG